MNENEVNQRELFLIPEIRNGFSICEKQKKVWLVELELLKELLRICNKYDIKVVSFAGTLLGAVRHKGFIPWDDDMDVCMDRENFEKLLKVPCEEFQAPFFLQTALSDRKYFFGYARLRNSETTGLISYYMDENYNNGIYIDIFVLDGYCDDIRKMRWQIKQRNFYSSLLAQYYKDTNKMPQRKKVIHFLIKNSICKLFSYEEMLRRYNKTLAKHTAHCKKLALLTHGEYYIKRYWCFKEDFNNTTMAKFEFITVPIFAEYDRILRSMYGDYMQFPPAEQRGKWHEGILILEPDIPYKEYIRMYKNEKNEKPCK